MISSRYAWCTPERFVDLTLRQLLGFMKAINRAKAIEFYESTLSYGSIHGAKLPSLEEFLGVSLGDKQASAFDSKTDEALEKIALDRLKKARGNG